MIAPGQGGPMTRATHEGGRRVWKRGTQVWTLVFAWFLPSAILGVHVDLIECLNLRTQFWGQQGVWKRGSQDLPAPSPWCNSNPS